MFASMAGVHIINIKRTWEKLLLAARVIVSIENPADVCVISARPYGQVLCNAVFSFELCFRIYPRVSRSPMLEPKYKFSLFLGKNFLEKHLLS